MEGQKINWRKEFEDFLKSLPPHKGESIYVLFGASLKIGVKHSKISPYSIDAICKTNEPINFISNSFMWVTSKEGQFFWVKINHLWQIRVTDLENIKNSNGCHVTNFDEIRKNCTPMEALFISNSGEKRLYLGFTRTGKLVTDCAKGYRAVVWDEEEIKNWKSYPIKVSY